MRRLPDDHTLEAWLERGGISREQMGSLAARLAGFHAKAARRREIARYGRFEVVAHNCRENFEQLHSFVGRTISAPVYERLRARTEAELQRHRVTIEARSEEGIPCETHGDLRVDHVYLFPDRDPPEDLTIIDCIEFNERFRHADPVADLAFLVMDLHARGAWNLASTLVDTYFEVAADAPGRGLLPLYTAYRATVRSKVESMKLDEPEISEQARRSSRDVARARALLALGELSSPAERPCVVMVGGLPGTGKSTVARMLAETGDFAWVRSDVVRKELAGVPPSEHAHDELAQDLYSSEWTERTYQACLERAAEHLFEGRRVLLDATYKDRKRRRQVWDVARAWGVPCLLILCEVEADVVRGRLQDRSSDDPSDADWSVYEQVRNAWEPITDDEAPRVRRLSTAGGRDETLARAGSLLRQAGLA